MSRFTLFITLLLCLLITPLFVSAAEYKLEDFGAVVDDGIDDSQALQDALTALFIKGGGTILFPGGKIDLKESVRIVPNDYVGGDVKFKGNQGSVIEISVGATKTAFYAGNLNILTFEDLAIIGKNVPFSSPDFYDAKYVIHSSYTTQTNILRCQLYGLAVPDNSAIVYTQNTDTLIKDSQFDGSVALYPNGAVILAENTMGLTVSRTTFADYANFHGTYLAKTPALAGSWIKVKGGMPVAGNGQRRITIENSRFDEGAATAISMENIAWAHIIGVNVNVNNTDAGRGIFLKGVEYAKIEQSWFGYAPSRRPALDFESVGGAEVTSLKFGGGVYFFKQFYTMKIGISYCPQCVEMPPTRPLETSVKKK